MNRLPMPLAYACSRLANGCLLQLQSTVDRVASRPVEQLRKPVRRHPASTHISMRSCASTTPTTAAAEVAHPSRSFANEPCVKASLVSHPIEVDWLRDA